MPSPDVNQQYFGTKTVQSMNSDGVWGAVVNRGSVLTRWDKVLTSSVRTPNFKSLKRKRNLPFNPYSYSNFQHFNPLQNFTVRVVNANGTLYGFDSYVGNVNDFLPLTSVAVADDPYRKASSKLLAKSSLAKTNAAVGMAEAGKTAAHLAHTASRIANALIALKRLRFGDFANSLGITHNRKTAAAWDRTRRQLDRAGESRVFLRNQVVLGRKHRTKSSAEQTQTRFMDFAADTWLEYSYGWKPLFQDVYGHAEALASVHYEQNGIVRVVSGKAETQIERTELTQLGTWSVKRSTTSTRSCRVTCFYKIPIGTINPVHAFGMNNPLELAWELVPFSFVADWFLPIGDALKSLTATSGLEFASGYRTDRELTTNTCECSGNGQWMDAGGGRKYQGSANVVASEVGRVKTRSILNSFPMPNWPEWKDPRSLSHSASALALLNSIFLRK